MSKITKRLEEEVAELDEYVIRNEKNINERAVNINKRFTDCIKAMKKEILDLERGMYGIHEVHETCPSLFDDEEFAMNKTYVAPLKRENC